MCDEEQLELGIIGIDASKTWKTNRVTVYFLCLRCNERFKLSFIANKLMQGQCCPGCRMNFNFQVQT